MIKKKQSSPSEVKYPGILTATDGSSAVVHGETLASEAAGAYPITPSTLMGEGWAQAVAAGKTNVHGRRLLFFEPEGEHAAAAVTAGMSMVGLRSTNFSSGQGIAYMHESLYAAAGKRLTYVLNVAARAITKHSLNVHAGHDDYHAVDDSGFFQMFAKDVQEAGDFSLIAHRIAELSLTPGLAAQDGFLTSHVIESARLAEPDLIKEYLGDPADEIVSPTPAQKLVFGEMRRRIPEMFDLDFPATIGAVQNQDSYAQGVAAQRPFYFDHVAELTDQSFAIWAELTGRRYARASGYRLDDAEWVLAGQGSIVSNMEVVADYLRETRGIKIGVLNVTMFRPFPADLITELLRGTKGVTVFERVDQPLAVEAPLLREIRAALAQGMENWRATRSNGKASSQELPFPGLTPIKPDDIPDLYSAGFGFGSRDIQPGDIIAAFENMQPGAPRRRQFYLGIDFIRKGTRLPKLQIWQEKLLDSYPHVENLALESVGDLNLLPEGSIALRIHSVGGWGAITMGKNLTLTAFELFGLEVKANPKYGSEKKGQPTTFYSVLSHSPVLLNGELKHVNVVLAPDGNVFSHSDPLAGMDEDGVFIIQGTEGPEALWTSLPERARRFIQEKNISVWVVDGFQIATEEASDADLRFRMQGATFMGAFFAASPLVEREGVDRDRLFEGIRAQLQKKFGHLGERVVEDNIRLIQRGFNEVRPVDTSAHGGEEDVASAPGSKIPTQMAAPDSQEGIGNPGQFFEQVCSVCAMSQDVIADPFTAISAMPAATSAVRDMTHIRFEVPDFIPELCTGCSQCWVQCPDTAIPGLVTPIEELLDTAIRHAANGRSTDRVKQISKHLARESRKTLKGVPFKNFGEIVSASYKNVVEKLGWDADRRAQLDEEFAAVYSVLAEFPVAKTTPFFDLPESKEKDSGALLSITINPEACKGCNLCVDVCPEDALITVQQDDEIVDRLRKNWDFWEELPETNDRYVNVRNLDEGIGVLSSLLLKKEIYMSMAAGDGACMGCGEKTAVHLVLSTIKALMQPRVRGLVEDLDGLLEALDQKARALLASDADLEAAADQLGDQVEVELAEDKKERLKILNRTRAELKDLRWRYVQGPTGKGRSSMGIANSTGCSSVWGSTFPYNPYPVPWANHLFQDSPSLAIGIFEGHMRKMADAFMSLRRGRLLADDAYDADTFEPSVEGFDWQDFTDEEFHLCPPILAIGGDGAMLDIGFQNLSRMLASGKPIRVMVLDTQVYSNTGGQACTSGFTGQVADMSAWGKAQHGKTETRKELSFIAMAHRGTFVHQSSQASASHLIAGVIKGLQGRRPAIFNIFTPCPVEHGTADDSAARASRLLLESRAFPFLTYDPDEGESLSDCLNLDGNPALDDLWPTYNLEYVDDEGNEATMELPLTSADWAATEGRFRKNFTESPKEEWDDEQVPFHEYVEMGSEDREGLRPFIWTLNDDKQLNRLSVSNEMVQLAEDRLLFWNQLREMAGLRVPEAVKDSVSDDLEAEYEEQAAAIRVEYEAKIAELQATYPQMIARRLADGLLRAGNGDATVADLLARAESTPGLQPLSPVAVPDFGGGAPPQATPSNGGVAVGAPAVAAPAPATPAAAPAVAEDDDDELAMEPYIDAELCTTCDDCTNINSRMFAYNDNKQAYVADPTAGTFAQLVQAAEKCPVEIIHPGTPLNKKEKNLEKWIKRAEPFN